MNDIYENWITAFDFWDCESEGWRSNFNSERELPEILMNLSYFMESCHGTLGHNDRVIVAKFAKICDEYEQKMRVLTRLLSEAQMEK